MPAALESLDATTLLEAAYETRARVLTDHTDATIETSVSFDAPEPITEQRDDGVRQQITPNDVDVDGFLLQVTTLYNYTTLEEHTLEL